MIDPVSPRAREHALKGSAAGRDKRAKTEINWDDALHGLDQILEEVYGSGRDTP